MIAIFKSEIRMVIEIINKLIHSKKKMDIILIILFLQKVHSILLIKI